VLKPSAASVEAWSALLTAHRRLTTWLDADLRARAGMALEDYDVLFQIRRAAHPVRMSDLAGTVLISRPSATRVVERLVQQGFIRRWHDDSDRRVVLVQLTEAGRQAQRRAARVHLDGIARLVEAPLRGRDVPAIAAALRALAAAGAGAGARPASPLAAPGATPM
jgi:DNA-binding MarR family transcriptional regulator